MLQLVSARPPVREVPSSIPGGITPLFQPPNPGFNFNPGFFQFFCLKAFSRKFTLIFLLHPIFKLKTKRGYFNLLFELSYLNSNFALNLGFLLPALTNLAPVRKDTLCKTLRRLRRKNHKTMIIYSFRPPKSRALPTPPPRTRLNMSSTWNSKPRMILSLSLFPVASQQIIIIRKR